MNFVAIILAGLSGVAVGGLWYGALFSRTWMAEAGVSATQIEGASLVRIVSLATLLTIVIAFILQFSVIHQFGAFGMIGGDLSNAKPSFAAFMADYGNSYLTFKHGAMHGFMTGLLLTLPLITINGLVERKSVKYILIHGGYWLTTLSIMGGILGAFPAGY